MMRGISELSCRPHQVEFHIISTCPTAPPSFQYSRAECERVAAATALFIIPSSPKHSPSFFHPFTYAQLKVVLISIRLSPHQHALFLLLQAQEANFDLRSSLQPDIDEPISSSPSFTYSIVYQDSHLIAQHFTTPE